MDHPSASGGEIRLDIMTGRWVIMAPRRSRRPRDHQPGKTSEKRAPAHDPGCPFCPGNEARLSAILFETGDGGRWSTRVVANKYPALSPENSRKRQRDGIHLKTGGFGRHEVVIETPRHDRHPAAMDVGEIETVVETYQRRYRELMAMDGIAVALIFRNHGRRAGTSLDHPHSQIVAAGLVPQDLRMRENTARRYHRRRGRCLLCDVLAFEIRKGARLVMENASFAAFVPFAADVPYETWIVPKEHQADFGDLPGRQKGDLAAALHRILKCLRDKLDDPHYNYVIDSAARRSSDAPHLHWIVRIKPRLTTRAGFEIGSGIRVNPSLPEADAAFLRSD